MLSLTSAYKCHEDARKHEYGQCITETKHGFGFFTPLASTSTGGNYGLEGTLFYKTCRLTSHLLGITTYIQFNNSLVTISSCFDHIEHVHYSVCVSVHVQYDQNKVILYSKTQAYTVKT